MPNYTNEILGFILKWQLSIQWSQIYGHKVKKDYNSFDKFIFIGWQMSSTTLESRKYNAKPKSCLLKEFILMHVEV